MKQRKRHAAAVSRRAAQIIPLLDSGSDGYFEVVVGIANLSRRIFAIRDELRHAGDQQADELDDVVSKLDAAFEAAWPLAGDFVIGCRKKPSVRE